MATIRLIPSVSAVSNSSYAAIANASNMYDDCDSTTYGTFTHNRASTNSTYYGYLRGFDFSDVPSNAVVSGWTVKIKASATGHTTSTSSSYYMSLVNGTTQIGSTSASGRLSTSVTTFTFAEGSLDWDTIKGYGSNFGIRIPLRRASSNTADVVSVYGAEIEVTYTLPVYHDVTVSNSTSATVAASDTHPMEGSDVTITADTLDGITVTDNGTDVTALFEAHYPDTTASTDLGSFALVSGGFNSGQSWFEGIEGNGADTTETTTSNYYSSGSGTIAVFTYDMGITVPSNAEVTRLWCEVSGHAESTSNSSEYMCAQLISGSTELTDELNFKEVGTSNSVQTLEATTLPTVAQLAAMKLQCRLGYYGGAINGATAHVEYEVPGSAIAHYEYTIANITADHAIVVSAAGGPELYVKQGSAWAQVSRAYRKVSGSWTQVSLDQAFQAGVNYVRG